MNNRKRFLLFTLIIALLVAQPTLGTVITQKTYDLSLPRRTTDHWTLKNYADDRPLLFIAEDKSLVSINNTTKMITTKNKLGQTRITVRYFGGAFSFTLHVEKPILNIKSAVVSVGKTYTVELFDTVYKPKWKSSNPSVATVNSKTGRVKALKVGKIILSCEALGQTYRSQLEVVAAKKNRFSFKTNRPLSPTPTPSPKPTATPKPTETPGPTPTSVPRVTYAPTSVPQNSNYWNGIPIDPSGRYFITTNPSMWKIHRVTCRTITLGKTQGIRTSVSLQNIKATVPSLQYCRVCNPDMY